MALENVIVLGVSEAAAADDAGRLGLAREVARAARAGLRVLVVLPGDRAAESLAERAASAVSPTVGAAGRAEAAAAALTASADSFVERLGTLGVSALRLDPAEAGPVTRGNPMEAQPRRVSARSISLAFDEAKVVVMAGDVGRDEAGGLTLLGSGGTSLSAAFVADRLALPMHWFVGEDGASLALLCRAAGAGWDEDGGSHVIDIPGSVTPEHAMLEAGISRRALLFARASRVEVVPVAVGLVDAVGTFAEAPERVCLSA